MDIAAWLSEIGLGAVRDRIPRERYRRGAPADADREDLRELGVESLGHRKRLLAAIAALSTASTVREPAAAAERRQLTVMFVDLATRPPSRRGSTRRTCAPSCAATRLGYRRGGPCRRSCRQADGRRRPGLFWLAACARGRRRGRQFALDSRSPRPWAAVRAPDGTPLAARVGIATGLVVVGDLIGEGAAREESVVGETPNHAARLQAAATPGSGHSGRGYAPVARRDL